jgi:hypothetical protein
MSGLATLCSALILATSPTAMSPSLELREIPTGTLLYLQHSNPLVASWTQSDVTHVALAVQKEETTWVYEATPGQVRRVELESYLEELSRMNRGERRPMELWALAPIERFQEQECRKLQEFLDQQLGRRYSVRNYLRQRDGEGIHCGELAASALTETGRFHFKPFYSQAPGVLVERLRDHCQQPIQIAIPERSETPSWRTRTWQRWTAFRNWCPWACYETWTFCW